MSEFHTHFFVVVLAVGLPFSAMLGCVIGEWLYRPNEKN